MALSVADAKDVLDSLAQQAENIKELGFDANTTGYSNNRTTILAAAIDVAADMAGAFEFDVVAAFSVLFNTRRLALEKNLGSINAFLLTNDSRVHPHLRDYVGWSLKPANVMQIPVITNMGDIAVITSTTGTFTDGAAVDKTKFGKVWLELEVINQITGAAVVDLTIIGTKLDGTPQSVVAPSIPATSAVGFKVNVGTLGLDADHFADVTDITVQDGTSGDDVQVNSRIERIIAL